GDAPLRFPDPRREQCEADHDEDDSDRDPHDQPAELLIFKRSATEWNGPPIVDGIPDRSREGKQRAMNSAVHCSSEDVEYSSAISHVAIAAVHQRPPEEQRCA